jgi:acetyl-CoA C-acetyltransferase
MADVIGPALDHAGLPAEAVDGIFVGCMNNGFSRQDFTAALPGMVVPELSHVPAIRVENACATGSAALYAALDWIAAGHGEVVLVVGVEKMTALPTDQVGEILLGASYYAQEGATESGFAGLFGRIANSYFQQHGDQSDALARIAEKNHANGVHNPYAHMRRALTFEQCAVVSDRNPYVAPPLRRTDCSLISDGAAALVLASDRVAGDLKRAIGFRARAQANDVLALSRRDPLRIRGRARGVEQGAWVGRADARRS